MIKTLINNAWHDVPDEQLLIGGEQFAFGYGLYETMRTMQSKPVFLQQHLDRLFSSLTVLKFSLLFTRKQIADMIYEVIDSSPIDDLRVRVIITNTNCIVYSTLLNLDETIYDGVKTITMEAGRKFAELKTTEYSNFLKSWEKAQSQGCFEAILVDEQGMVTEGSRSNIFWVKNGFCFTREIHVLPGVTRELIIQNTMIPVEYSICSRNQLISMDEVFLTNSGSGVVPVIAVNNQIIGNGLPGKLTAKIKSFYDQFMLENVNVYSLN